MPHTVAPKPSTKTGSGWALHGIAVPLAKYLGCWLNDKGDPEREVKQRIANCMAILKKLDIFWRKADPGIKQKILVYDAVVRAKLVYGLESAVMNESVKHKLDVFQLRGLRKILHIHTTFVDRSQDNNRIMSTAQKAIDEQTTEGKTAKQIQKISKVYEGRKVNLLSKIILEDEGSPMKAMTFEPGTTKPTKVNARIGQPRVKWVETGLEALWKQVGETIRPDLKNMFLDLDKQEHIDTLTQAARKNTCGKETNQTT